jgi:Putative peptidoglycan binding domain/L,D-transpeptidase catalytic domain
MAVWSRARRIAGPLGMALAAALALAACEIAAADGTASRRPAAQQASAPSATKPAATTTTAGTRGATGAKPSRTTGTPPATTSRPAPPPRLRLGDHGAAVLSLQRRLAALHYQIATPDGEFGSETHHAVVAFQKVNHLDRDGVAGPRTMRALEHPRQPSPRSRSGFHIEADLTLQVVYVVDGSRIEQILDASSASGRTYEVDGDVRVAHTPEGSFHVERKINAWHRSPLGLLYRPAYFVGGYALHGAPSVPPFPASHGCIRITTAAMDRLYDRLALGTPLQVYRS